MGRILWKSLVLLAVAWVVATGATGGLMLPPMLLRAPVPERSRAQREVLRAESCPPGCRWQRASIVGGEGAMLDVWRMRRPHHRGVVVSLHGFGDDAWGGLSRIEDLPGWDFVCFTFRGRDLHPEVPSTLGGWERADVVAVVRNLEAEGTPRGRILIIAASQGAGVALLALSDLERAGGPLGGALLECPYQDLRAAARDHVKGTLGCFEFMARPAEWIGLWRAGRLARFDPDAVSPERAARGLRTPVALLTGDADPITPLEGVRAIARACPDLTIVPGAGHCQAASRVAGGWRGWAEGRMRKWGR